MGTNMKAWLFTILRNELYSQMRKRGREVQDSDGYFTERWPSTRRNMARWISRTSSGRWKCCRRDQREAIILVGASGFSYEEAAEICGCAVGTIKSRVNRARQRLQDILQVTGESDYGPDATSAPITSRAFVS